METTVKVAIIRNPFDPVTSREIRECDAGLTVARYMGEFISAPVAGIDFAVAVNGNLVEHPGCLDMVLSSGDSLSFCAVPHGGSGSGKNLFAAVAMIAVMIAAPYAGAWAFGSMGASGWTAGVLGASKLGASLVTAGTMIAGGLIVNSIFPAKLPQFEGIKSNWEQSQTYGWAVGPNEIDVGGVLPDLYGTFRVTPKVLARYVETQGDKQYLNILMAVAGHKVDSIADIEINDQPSANYDDITIETRLGDNDQAVISNFTDNRNDTNIGSKFTTSWQTRQLSAAVDGFGVGLVAPQGLWYSNDNGQFDPNSVSIEIQYRKVGHVAWRSWIGRTLTGWESKPLRWFFEQKTPYADLDQYEYRFRFSAAPATGTRYASDVWVDYHQQVVNDPFTFPNTALLAVRALATDQLSGPRPRITALVTRSAVPVYTGTAYDDKPATNPAWINYHQLHNEMTGAGVSASRIIYDEFKEFADWCDAEGFACNIYFDTAQNLKAAMDTVSMLGRGQVVQIGSRFGVFVDKPDAAVQRFSFGMGNIQEDSFAEEWLPMTDRADVIEVTYWDADHDYRREVVTIYQDGFDGLEREANIQSVVLYGCTDRDMAARHGKFLLNKNRWLTLTSSWGADIDAIACRVNDVVDVSHDVPEWGYSGRVVSADTNELVLDRDITMEPGTTYVVEVRHGDDTRESHTMTVASSTTTDTLVISDGWTDLPEKYDNYLFGEMGKQYKQFRILNISRDADLRRKISALEYVAEVYDDAVSIPPPAALTIGSITGLGASEVWITSPDGAVKTVVNLSWRGAGGECEIFYRRNTTTDPWVSLGTTRNSFYQTDIPLTQDITYDFRVARTDGRASAATVLTIEGKPWAPTVPQNLSLFAAGAGIVAKWDHITDIDRKEYIVSVGGAEYTRTAANSCVIDLPLTPQVYAVEVVAVSWDKQESDPLGSSITIQAPAQPTVASHQVLATTVKLTWDDCTTSFPISHYTVNGEVVSGRVYTERITWVGEKNFVVTAVDVSGNEGTANTATVTILAIPAPTVLTATGRPYEIKLDVTYTKTDEFAALEIWAATLNNRNEARKIAETGGTSHTVSGLDIGDTRYYWIRVRNEYGDHSDWYPASSTGGVLGAVSTDPAMYLDILAGAVDELTLTEALAARIDLIDTSFLWDEVYEEGVEGGLEGSFSSLYGMQQAFREDLNTLEGTTNENLSLIHSLETEIAGLIAVDWEDKAWTDGQFVRHDGSVWICQQTHSSPSPEPGTDEAYWTATDSIGTLLSDLDVRVDDLAAEITTKATQVDFDALSGTVGTHTTQITQNADTIALKADSTEVDQVFNLFLPDFDVDETYSVGAFVRHGGFAYECIQGIFFTPAPAPDVSPAYWDAIDSLGAEVTTALSQVTVNADNIELVSQTITGPLTYDDVYDEVFVEWADDVGGLDVRLTSARIELDSQDARITLAVADIDTLEGRMASAESTITANTTDIGAEATRVDTLIARVDSNEDQIFDNVAAIISEAIARAGGDSALATQISSLDARVGDNETDILARATIAQLNQAVANIYGASVESFTNINAEFISQQEDINSRATIAQLDQAKVDIYSASVTSFTNINAEFNGVNASVSENSTAISTLDGQVKAEKTLWLNANGHVTGYRNVITGEGESIFDIVTNRFRIINQNNAGDIKVPFVVGNVNGVSTVGISGDLIIDGTVLARHIQAHSITADHIGTNEIIASAANIKDGIITNAHIANATITDAKIASLDAGKITAGTLAAERIGASSITANKLAFSNLAGLNTTEGSKLAGIAAGADVTLTALNGGIFVTGGGITLDSGGAIKGGQSDYATGEGWFLGYSGGDYKFSIGSDTEHMWWDGDRMRVSGHLNQTAYPGLDVILAETAGLAGYATSYPPIPWSKRIEVLMERGGTFRIKFYLKYGGGYGGTQYLTAQIRVNDEPVSPEYGGYTGGSQAVVEPEFDVYLDIGDRVQLWVKLDGAYYTAELKYGLFQVGCQADPETHVTLNI